jgi:hypothetical protein
MKSPIAVRNFAAPIAAPFVAVGRTLEHVGSFRLKKMVGSGMISRIQVHNVAFCEYPCVSNEKAIYFRA